MVVTYHHNTPQIDRLKVIDLLLMKGFKENVFERTSIDLENFIIIEYYKRVTKFLSIKFLLNLFG